MTSSGPIPEELRIFIVQHVDSVALLEALLLLRSTSHAWSADEMGRRLYLNSAQAADVMAQLASQDLAVVEGSAWRYRNDGPWAHIVDELAATYARHLIAVTNLIHARPSRLRQFADAFILGRSK